MPGLIVMKFGGTSVADAQRIKRAAQRIVSKREAGFRVVAVLSARGSTTDELIAMAQTLSADPDPRGGGRGAQRAPSLPRIRVQRDHPLRLLNRFPDHDQHA